MVASMTAPVLRCGLCEKPFDKDSTLKRHIYYCRSKGSKPSALRVRACRACAKSKARCDFGLPHCSSCVLKGRVCTYTSAETVPPEKNNRASLRFPKTPATTVDTSSEVILQEAVDLVPTNVSTVEIPRTEIDLELEEVDRWLSDLDQDTLKIPANWLNTSSAQWLGVSQPLMVPTPSLSSFDQHIILRGAISSSPASTLVLSTLKSYFLELKNHGSLPPFIHPQLAFNDPKQQRGEALQNCLSLMRLLFSSDNKTSITTRNLFWRSVEMECIRMRDMPLLDKFDVLERFQALAIYLLVRLDEGYLGGEKSIDGLLMNTVTFLSRRFYGSNISQSPAIQLAQSAYHAPEDYAWREYLFEESYTRVALIYQTVNLIFHFDPALLCNLPPGILIAPLPSHKLPWEARTALEWEMKYSQTMGRRREGCFALGVKGELLEVGDGKIWHERSARGGGEVVMGSSESGGVEDRKIVAWEEWCEGMDGLGSLVVLAASLVG